MPHNLQLLLLLAIIVAAAKLAGALANRIGQPSVFGEILVGLILGPTVFNVLGLPLFQPHEVAGHAAGPTMLGLVKALAEVGVVLLMFIAGMETNSTRCGALARSRSGRRRAGSSSRCSVARSSRRRSGCPLFWDGIFIGTILTATSVSISAQTLIELNALRSKEGSTILGAAVIDDVQGIILLSIVVAFARATGDVQFTDVALVVVKMLVYFGAAIFLGRYFTAIARWADGLGVSQGLLAVVLAVAFLYSVAAEAGGGVAAITQSYLAGVLFSVTPYKERIDHAIHPLTYSILVPVFFISIGLSVTAENCEHVWFTVALVAVAIVTRPWAAACSRGPAGSTARNRSGSASA
jgi:Kef-type K+ transport system membrane component KefB